MCRSSYPVSGSMLITLQAFAPLMHINNYPFDTLLSSFGRADRGQTDPINGQDYTGSKWVRGHRGTALRFQSPKSQCSTAL